MQRNFLPSALGKAFDFQDKSKTKWQGCFCITYCAAPPTPGSPSGHSKWLRAAPQPSAGMTGTSPGSFQRQGITGLRVCHSLGSAALPRGCTAGWRKPGIPGSVPQAHPCQGDPESALDMGHRSTEDLSCIVPIWIRNDPLRASGELLCWGGDAVQSRALGTGRKNHSQGIRNNPATVKGKWAGWGTR